jgi:hypothetical protein
MVAKADNTAPVSDDAQAPEPVPADSPAADTTSKGVQVSATIPADLHEKLKDIRWEKRLEKMTDVFRTALEEYAAKHHKA